MEKEYTTNHLFTSESVSEGHPDKVADQISDAVVDAYLAQDPQAKVACEVLVTTGQVVIAGEVRSSAYVDVAEVARNVIRWIGYTKSEYKFDADSCGILNAMHKQSDDIDRGVDRKDGQEQGAGDQGMMFGYACGDEDTEYMPLPLFLAHKLLVKLAEIRKEGKEMIYLRPDAKSQVTVEFNPENEPVRIHTIVLSTQHDEFVKADDGVTQKMADEQMVAKIEEDVRNVLLPKVKEELPKKLKDLFDDDLALYVNPTGKFVIGGPHGDSGLTGRKIIVDTYGGYGAHGGGAFSGKDPSKVDRSAAYAARHIAKNLVAAGVCREVLVQLSYAIGVAQPISIYVNSYGEYDAITEAEIAQTLNASLNLTPRGIINSLNLRRPIYHVTAAYGHFGREYEAEDGFFTWERLDLVNKFQRLFSTLLAKK